MNFQPNRRLARDLGRDRKFRDFLERTAKDAEREAKRIAQSEAFDTGAYSDGLKGEVGEDKGELIARVVGEDWKSGLVEFHPNPRSRSVVAPLRRAVEAAGLRVRRNR